MADVAVTMMHLQAAIRDEAEVVKAALAQTNIVVSAPTRQLADMDPTLNSPKGTEVLPR